MLFRLYSCVIHYYQYLHQYKFKKENVLFRLSRRYLPRPLGVRALEEKEKGVL